MTRLTLTEAHELAAAILRHAGFSEAFAQAIAATVTALRPLTGASGEMISPSFGS